MKESSKLTNCNNNHCGPYRRPFGLVAWPPLSMWETRDRIMVHPWKWLVGSAMRLVGLDCWCPPPTLLGSLWSRAPLYRASYHFKKKKKNHCRPTLKTQEQHHLQNKTALQAPNSMIRLKSNFYDPLKISHLPIQKQNKKNAIVFCSKVAHIRGGETATQFLRFNLKVNLYF